MGRGICSVEILCPMPITVGTLKDVAFVGKQMRIAKRSLLAGQ